MKDFFYDLLIESFTSNKLEGYTLGVLMWILLLSILAIPLSLVIGLIDHSFMPIKEKDGIITKKYVVPARSRLIFIVVSKVMTPIIRLHPTTYNLVIGINGLEGHVSVTQHFYDNVVIAEKVKCKYTNRILNDSIYIKSLSV
jgi:hypothetical protein